MYVCTYIVGREERVNIGFCGYPNVGKSSTINVLMGAKRTSVSATPGRTKHFQTLILDDDVMLCDCKFIISIHLCSEKIMLMILMEWRFDVGVVYRSWFSVPNIYQPAK
jgi:GTPase SAR1 family protein